MDRNTNTMKQRPLFRTEALEKKVNTYYGVVCINLPIKYQVVTIGMGLLTAMLIAFIMMAEVSEKYTVQGYINTSQGIASVYPKKPGIIIKQLFPRSICFMYPSRFLYFVFPF